MGVVAVRAKTDEVVVHVVDDKRLGAEARPEDKDESREEAKDVVILE
jgi:hypothetical protein